MASELSRYRLGDLCDLFDGPHATPASTATGPVFLGIASLNDGRLDTSLSGHLSEEDFAKWTRRVVPKPLDLVFSYETRLGQAALVPQGLRCCLGRRMALLRVKRNDLLDRRYLLYAFLGDAFQDTVRSNTIHGSTVDRIPLEQAPTFPIDLPPLPEQRAIAHILGTLDDKIDLNRQMSATLEAMARALFESWFVRFDPVRAKAEGRDTGLPADVAALFPDSFEQSEIGEVPKGWRVASLGALVDVARGLSYKGDGLSASGLPMFNLNSVLEGGGYKQAGLKHYSGAYKEQHLISAGDVIVANTEQGHERRLIGFAALVPARIPQPALFSHHLYRLRTRDAAECSNDFIYRWLNTLLAHDVVSGYANGTTVNMLPPDGLQTPQLCVPPPQLCSRFTSMNSLSQARQEELQEQTTLLTDLRDTLLPKLISGELRVPDAERVLVGAGVS